jgi:transposase-like protein
VAKRFLGKALNGLKDWEKPTVINTDKAPTYTAALAELKKEGRYPGGDAASTNQVPEQHHRGWSR